MTFQKVGAVARTGRLTAHEPPTREPMSFSALDPRLSDLAGEYIMAFPEAEDVSDTELEAARVRLAKAMQQAIDAEADAIRKELRRGAKELTA